MSIGIIVALSDELSTLTSARIAKGQTDQLANGIQIMLAGIGAENAQAAALRLIELGAEGLVSWGCATALSPALKPGDCILADRVTNQAGTKLSCNEAWLSSTQSHWPANLSVAVGAVAETRELLNDSRQKLECRQQSGALAADMESFAVADTARRAGKPWLVVRAIADPLTQSLPPAVSAATNAEGEIDRNRLVWHLLTHPTQIPEIIDLGKNFFAARKTLQSVSAHIDIFSRWVPNGV